MLSRIGDFLA